MSGAEDLVQAIKHDYRSAQLSPRDRAILDFAAKLTLTPAQTRRSDVELLREHGLGDAAISDVVQVTALFAYFNRLADGLGIDLEDDMPRRRTPVRN